MALFKKFEIHGPAKVANTAKNVVELADLSTLAATTKQIDAPDFSGLAALATSHPDNYELTADNATQIKQCYWCKSTDFWMGGSDKNAHLVCRRCHPPAPGAEKHPQ